MTADLLLVCATWYKLAQYRGLVQTLGKETFTNVLLKDGECSVTFS